MTGFDISGGWRPHPADYLAITGTLSPLPNEFSPHILGRALDITMVRYSEDWQSGYNLQAGASRIAQPWMTYGTYPVDVLLRPDMGNGFVRNAGRTPYEQLHLNH